MRLYSEHSLNPIRNPPDTASLAFVVFVASKDLLEDKFQLFFCLCLLLIQMETGELKFLDRFAKLGQI